MAFEWPLRVYIEDTDFGGIVYYVNYLKFMERARTEMLRQHGYSQQRLAEDFCLFVVHSVESRYLKPARLDDELIVHSAIEEAGAASLIFNQTILDSHSGQVLCEGRVRVACVNSQTFKPRRWPRELVMALNNMPD
ncbi:4-hydroxybenzoyl-CoA thioesterase family active site [Marinobacterium lacunae]|uniref:4-hydroxybenzoyl-CoA thioesterase family active site n=1 Tax=Marinobacterium lacunae TaxID=1232683 RepID=A0A081FU54_9GAMM|nr:tol-pal system-associated acyl-CoA thioesterase [Marinobacterium lacunae]KEA62059.1 4-hydroxybenzoyl-CoA thioesterase family active site [Marinobacterium lacunae]MBR9883028.1 tol-pal system-associated acyl-CoA thioesterase [Oceanospirillales bacterium]